MGTTPRYAWPYPELTDPPDGSGQIKALATATDNTVGAIDDRVRGTLTNFTGTWSGLNLGNATPPSTWYLRLGKLIVVNATIIAAASAPTTAFTSGNVTLTIPMKCTGSNAMGHAWFNSSGVSKLGFCGISWDQQFLTIQAIRPADMVMAAPAAVWGTAAWSANAVLSAYIILPVEF